jgi:glycosyltransferase involved in cell wall biosynthesis
MDLTNRPLVSVVVPSLNQGQFIEETILSILAQEYRPIEVIVVDGGSSDGTIEILRKYDNCIIWLSEPDGGQADAVNKGFGLANGRIVGWLNSDDVYFFRDTVRKVVTLFNAHRDVEILYGDVAQISRDGEVMRLKMWPEYDKRRILRSNMISQPAVFLRRNVVRREKLATGFVCLDYEYWVRLAGEGYQFLHVSEIFAGDRHHPGRISETMSSSLRDCREYVLRSYTCAQRKGARIRNLADDLILAIARVRASLKILTYMGRSESIEEQMAFPGRIGSIWRLLARQLLMSQRGVKDRWQHR